MAPHFTLKEIRFYHIIPKNFFYIPHSPHSHDNFDDSSNSSDSDSETLHNHIYLSTSFPKTFPCVADSPECVLNPPCDKKTWPTHIRAYHAPYHIIYARFLLKTTTPRNSLLVSPIVN